MSRPRGRVGALLLPLLAAPLPAQEPRVEIAFAAGAAASGPPAIAWLCGTLLPQRAEWPAGLASGASFVLRLDGAGLVIAPNAVALPEGAVAVGAVDLAPTRRALCVAAPDGTEDWYVPAEATVPPHLVRLLQVLRAGDVERAHTIDLSVAIGHLLGATAPGDPHREPLQLGAALCGEVTWQAWLTEEHLRVRGRSDGGLLLPAVLLGLAARTGNGVTEPLPLRAFVARDGDREEALRQMSRLAPTADRAALLAMLHGSDELRLTAIDSLVRLGATDVLPHIVGAAAPDLPLATVAATDALFALWPEASATTKRATRAALAASPALLLRALDPDRLEPGADRGGHGAPAAFFASGRLLLWLGILGAGLFTFWLRERARLRAYV